MKRLTYCPRGNREGSTLVLALIMIVMLSALAVAMAGMSGANVQVADNFRKLDNTRANAESGLEVMRYWMSKVAMSGNIAPSDRFSTLASKFQDALTAGNVTNIAPVCSTSTITISSVPLNSLSGQNFSAVLTKMDNDNVRLEVTGRYGSLSRTIRTNYRFGERAHTVFDFGVASKGPISLIGNVELSGNIEVASNAFIVSENALLALSITGNSMIAGDVKIVNPLAYVHIGTQAGVGGETGDAAMEHIERGVPPEEFPKMDPSPFYSYVPEENVLSTSVDLKKAVTLTNIRIPARMNPKFTGQATLNGVILIESPNVVEFGGGVDITGIIVTNGSDSDDSGTNQITFTGNVTCHPIDQLPQETQFQGLHSQRGTFMLAPGFKASFGGSFGTLSGAIAANGIKFYGNAGGTINGSVVNYSNEMMELSGNSDLYFNRSGLTEVPAGFVPEIVLHYDPTSYSEGPL